MRKAFYTSNEDVINKLNNIENQSQYINELILNDIHSDTPQCGFTKEQIINLAIIAYRIYRGDIEPSESK